MATGENIPVTLSNMITRLKEMTEPIPNDNRQQKYCELITLFLSHFGNERFLLSGSTPQRTRLRANKNEGDFDFLVVSEKVISAEHLEHNPNVPCFVRIRGGRLQDTFPTIQMIDGKYLPSDLLKSMRPEAFKHVKNICTLMSTLRSTQGENTRRISLDMKIKPGISLVIYANPQCVELCPHLGGKTDDTINQITTRLQTESIDSSDTLLGNVSTVAEGIHTYERISGTKNNTSDNLDIAYTNKPSPSNCKRAKVDDGRKNEPQLAAEKDKGDDLITIYYSYKTSKDFIPVFPIHGQLKALDQFKNRVGRKWPSPSIIANICKCELFVISKPALIDTDDIKDFCIAFNNAEMILANHMTEVQRTVILILKAYQKGTLKEIADDLTSFHWKSALYWVSEQANRTIIDEFSIDNVKELLKAVLEFMTNCLCTQYLEHYFLPSNLFASRNEEALLDMIPKIVELQEHPIEQLQEFFKGQKDGMLNFDMVPRSKIHEINNRGESSLVEPIISTLREISLEDRETLRVALKSTIEEGSQFFLDELSPDIDATGKVGSQFIRSIMEVDIVRNSVIDGVVSALINSAENDQNPNLEELMQSLFSLVLQNALMRQ